MLEVNNFAFLIKQLIDNQLNNWEFAASKYAELGYIQTKRFDFDDFTFVAQFNPARIISSSAKVDKETIQKRPCFLCSENRPKEQESVNFLNEYEILINPYPIFPQHLTIVHNHHVQQLIQPYFADMLELAKSLPGFTIFYNGPKSGASAPDHFHFQAGTNGYMPVDAEIMKIKLRYGLYLSSDDCDIWKINDGIRKFILLESSEKESIIERFHLIFEQLKTKTNSQDEPGLNIHCSFKENKWHVLIFARSRHRPWHYDALGKDNFLFSPASVDMGGLLVIPRQKDFKKINKLLAIDMMKQIGIDEEIFNFITL
jgi:hypothetical protein